MNFQNIYIQYPRHMLLSKTVFAPLPFATNIHASTIYLRNS